jgi:hypothetical protein
MLEQGSKKVPIYPDTLFIGKGSEGLSPCLPAVTTPISTAGAVIEFVTGTPIRNAIEFRIAAVDR